MTDFARYTVGEETCPETHGISWYVYVTVTGVRFENVHTNLSDALNQAIEENHRFEEDISDAECAMLNTHENIHTPKGHGINE
jgi:hypothetical protein